MLSKVIAPHERVIAKGASIFDFVGGPVRFECIYQCLYNADCDVRAERIDYSV